VVAGVADRILVMYAGKPVEVSTVDEVFYNPRMPYTLGLLGSLPRMDQDEEMLTPIQGAPPSLVNLPPGCPFSPRCPLVADICLQEEPPLMVTTSADHLAACHRWTELQGDVNATDFFDATASDTEAVS
jgi:peptide/nickel transport system ATP-binding protein